MLWCMRKKWEDWFVGSFRRVLRKQSQKNASFKLYFIIIFSHTDLITPTINTSINCWTTDRPYSKITKGYFLQAFETLHGGVDGYILLSIIIKKKHSSYQVITYLKYHVCLFFALLLLVYTCNYKSLHCWSRTTWTACFDI